MAKEPQTIEAVPSPFEKDVYKWYDSLDFTYFVSGMANGGTGKDDKWIP